MKSNNKEVIQAALSRLVAGKDDDSHNLESFLLNDLLLNASEIVHDVKPRVRDLEKECANLKWCIQELKKEADVTRVLEQMALILERRVDTLELEARNSDPGEDSSSGHTRQLNSIASQRERPYSRQTNESGFKFGDYVSVFGRCDQLGYIVGHTLKFVHIALCPLIDDPKKQNVIKKANHNVISITRAAHDNQNALLAHIQRVLLTHQACSQRSLSAASIKKVIIEEGDICFIDSDFRDALRKGIESDMLLKKGRDSYLLINKSKQPYNPREYEKYLDRDYGCETQKKALMVAYHSEYGLYDDLCVNKCN